MTKLSLFLTAFIILIPSSSAHACEGFETVMTQLEHLVMDGKPVVRETKTIRVQTPVREDGLLDVAKPQPSAKVPSEKNKVPVTQRNTL